MKTNEKTENGKRQRQTLPDANSRQGGKVVAYEPRIRTDSDDGTETYLTPDDFLTDEWIEQIYSDPKRLSISTKTICFHNLDAKGNPVGINDMRIFTYIKHTQHIFVCGGVPYIYRNGFYEMDFRGTVIKSMIRDCCLEKYVKSTAVKRVYELFLMDVDLEKQPYELNQYPPEMVNFENGMFNAATGRMEPHDPKFYSINQIPWKYDPRNAGSGENIKKFLTYSIPDGDDREMLLEYIGLTCSIDSRQQKMLVIRGNGGTGKSTMINLIQAIVGKRNTSNISMNKLSEKFHAIHLMGKLLNACADLEIDALDDVSAIKKLVGEDEISDSYKGKDNISFANYAKMIYSTNELPTVRNEKTRGFYRRLLILTMDKKPEKMDPGLQTKLENEIPYLICLAMNAFRRLVKRGKIKESDNSVEMVAQLRKDSDTVEAFLADGYELTENDSDKISRTILFEKYEEYCKTWGRQPHSRMNFYKALRNRGLKERKWSQGRYFIGLRVKEDDDGYMAPPERHSDDDIPLPDPVGEQMKIPFEA